MTEALSKCVEYQRLIEAHKEKVSCEIAMMEMAEFDFVDKQFGITGMAAALSHLQDCEACQQWADTIYPERLAQRKRIAAHQKRLAKYCCGQMMHAMNEADAGVKVEFAYFRDEICWRINNDWTFAQYCPWCGKALPDKPFE
jgi:hypothetical protein